MNTNTTSTSTSQISQNQQQNYLFWLKDRGLADAPSYTPATLTTDSSQAVQQPADLSPPASEQNAHGMTQKRTQVHICHLMNSCQEFKRRPREIELFRKIITALNLSKEHYIVADTANLKQKLDLFEPAHFILWGLTPDHDTKAQSILSRINNPQVIKTHSPSQILKSPEIKRDVWQKIGSLKI